MEAASSPPLVSPLAGAITMDQGKKSFAQVVSNSVVQSTFRLSMRYPVEVDGEQGFVFSEVEMSKAVDDFKFALVLKFSRIRPCIDEVRYNVTKSLGSKGGSSC